MAQQPTPTQVIERMLQLRQEIQDLEREHKERIKGLKQQYERGENWLLAHMHETGHEKFTAGGATVYTTRTQRASIPDWTAFSDYIRQTGDVDLLQKRVATNNLKALVDSGAELPPGLKVDEVVNINIRRSS